MRTTKEGWQQFDINSLLKRKEDTMNSKKSLFVVVAMSLSLICSAASSYADEAGRNINEPAYTNSFGADDGLPMVEAKARGRVDDAPKRHIGPHKLTDDAAPSMLVKGRNRVDDAPKRHIGPHKLMEDQNRNLLANRSDGVDDFPTIEPGFDDFLLVA
jgi:hypothetical protein